MTKDHEFGNGTVRFLRDHWKWLLTVIIGAVAAWTTLNIKVNATAEIAQENKKQIAEHKTFIDQQVVKNENQIRALERIESKLDRMDRWLRKP